MFKEVQKALAKQPSAEELKKESPAFKLLRQNTTKINKHLLDIQKVYDQVSYDNSSDEDDEDLIEEKAVKQDKQLLIDEITRLVKVMGDIAVDLKEDRCAITIQSQLYDMKKGGPQNAGDGLMVEVKLDNLSEEQLKLTPFINLSHFPPEKQGS